MINYLFSGIDKVSGFTKEQATSLKKDIKDNSINIFYLCFRLESP